MLRHEFRAMGTAIELLLDAVPGVTATSAFAAAEAEFERLEAILSRFRPESELSELNRAGSLVAGPDLFEVVRLALFARERTAGRFDPTVHDALVAAGYDRTFDEIRSDRPGAAVSLPAGGGVRLDAATRTIELDPGVKLDLGGIGKGYAVERAADVIAEAGPALANAGGDLAVRGRPGGGVWPVGLEAAGGSLTLGLERGAVATSGRDRRTWRRGGRTQHHLIDPATGRPSSSDLIRASVVCDDAVDAEVCAKALFLAGATRARREADAAGIPTLLVTESGETILAGGLAA